MKTTMKNPFSSQQLKEMVDKLEDIRDQNLSSYNNAASNKRDDRQSLLSIICDDDKSQLLFSENRYDILVESGIKFLQERRHQEKERLEAYLEIDEQDIAARIMQRDKATE
jgi:hypothetical protein